MQLGVNIVSRCEDVFRPPSSDGQMACAGIRKWANAAQSYVDLRPLQIDIATSSRLSRD